MHFIFGTWIDSSGMITFCKTQKKSVLPNNWIDRHGFWKTLEMSQNMKHQKAKFVFFPPFNTIYQMDHIPAEILHLIFSRLDLKGRLECMLVCQFWCDTLDQRSLLQDVYLTGY
jgi:hypothetical protein